MSRASLRVLAWAMLALLLTSCSAEDEPLTQIVVVIDGDFSGLTRFKADVEGFKDPTTIDADLEDEPLPRRFSLVHDGGPLGPMAVTVSAYTDSDEPILIEPRTNMFFEPGRTLLLKIDLLAACVGLCDEGEACVAPGECVSSDEAAVLIPWTGNPDDLVVGGPLDAGMDSGMMSVPDGSMEEGGTIEDTGIDAEPPPDATDPEDAQMDAADDALVDEPDAEVDTGVDAFVPEPTWQYLPSNVDLEDGPLAALERFDVVLDCGEVTIDSSDPPSTSGFCHETPTMTVYDQPDAGGEVLIVVMSSLQIDLNSSLKLSGTRPIVLLVEGDATIDGTIDASAQGAVGGPGADDASCAGSLGVTGNNAPSSGLPGASGGSGGGFGSAGSNSGGSSSTASVLGGAMGGEPTLVPLRGGCRGGAGGLGEVVTTNAAPGGGGGAVQLSIAGTLWLTGVIDAGGGGGAPGQGNQGGGGGGGSGGAVLIEAKALAIDPSAVVTTNGGAGGGGQPTGTLDSTGGADGSVSTTPATGGTGSGPGGDGGRGASLGNSATNGSGAGIGGTCFPVQTTCYYGGGGGGAGGLGRIRVRGAISCALPGVFSPEPSVACESCTSECPLSPDPSCVARESASRLYYVCTAEVSWDDARMLCQGSQLDLVEINDQVENDYLFSQSSTDTWIGAFDSNDNDDWRWIVDNGQFWSGDDGGNPVNDSFEDWRSGEPNGSGDCARITSDGWADEDCDQTYPFICEQP